MTSPDEYNTTDYLAEFYEHNEVYRARQDVDFYVKLAKEADGPTLEVGCGTGRVLLPSAQAGVTITGIDLSTPMLEVCRARLAEEPADVQARVTLARHDMRAFDLGQQFALITTPFRGFQHMLTVEDQLAALDCFRRHLIPGGLLVLDLFNPSLPYLVDESRLGEFGDEPEFTLPDGRRVLRRTRILNRDLFAQVQHVELIHHVTHPDGREETQSQRFPLRYLFRYEAEHLLAHAGFSVEALYADYAYSPYGSTYPGDLIFVARSA